MKDKRPFAICKRPLHWRYVEPKDESSVSTAAKFSRNSRKSVRNMLVSSSFSRPVVSFRRIKAQAAIVGHAVCVL